MAVYSEPYEMPSSPVLMEDMCLSAPRNEEKIKVDLMQKKSDTGHHEWQASMGSLEVREE